jgi:hypothetical protein
VKGFLPSVETANKIFYFKVFFSNAWWVSAGYDRKKQGWAFPKESGFFFFWKMPTDFLCSISASANTVFFFKTKKKNEQVFTVMQRLFPVPNELP